MKSEKIPDSDIQPREFDGDKASSPPAWGSMFGRLLKWSAVFISLGGVALHIAGFAYHSAYDRAWGLDSDLFPKPTEWTLMTGYYVMSGGLAALFKMLLSWKLVAWGLCIAVACTLAIELEERGKEDWFKQQIRKLGRKLPRWLQTPLFSLVYALALCFLVVSAPVLAIVVLYSPDSLARQAGNEAAKKEIVQFSKGCEASDSRHRCIVLKRAGAQDLRGFLIESSDTLFAVFVPEKKRLEVVRRESVELSIDVPLVP